MSGVFNLGDGEEPMVISYRDVLSGTYLYPASYPRTSPNGGRYM